MLRGGIAGLVMLLLVGVAFADVSRGKLKGVDAKKDTITVTVGNNDVKFVVKDATITAGNKDISIKGLKVGDQLTVTHNKNVASKVAKGKKDN